jgi:Helix-turn-helix domain
VASRGSWVQDTVAPVSPGGVGGSGYGWSPSRGRTTTGSCCGAPARAWAPVRTSVTCPRSGPTSWGCPTMTSGCSMSPGWRCCTSPVMTDRWVRWSSRNRRSWGRTGPGWTWPASRPRLMGSSWPRTRPGSIGPGSVSGLYRAREEFGARLRVLRQEHGLNGKELATVLGWPASKVSKIELGRQRPGAVSYERARRPDNTPASALSTPPGPPGPSNRPWSRAYCRARTTPGTSWPPCILCPPTSSQG